jgi:cysteine desulfurase
LRIYLDHNATTPIRREVLEAMSRALRDGFGNASSVHAEGAAARAAVERAREQVAALIGAEPGEIVFTAGATEANNAALFGSLPTPAVPARLVTTTAEHPSVAAPADTLAAQGHRVVRVGVDGEGRLDAAALGAALAEPAALCAVLLANNETGVLQDGRALGALCAERGVPLHLDATQALGRVPVDVRSLGASLLSGSAHKLNGPQGSGFLYRRRGLALAPFVRGGPQEKGARGGTENVAGAVGLGVACELALREQDARARAFACLRDRLWNGIREKIPGVRRNGAAAEVLPNTLSVEFAGADGETLLQALDLEGIAVSTGAACSSGSIEPSHVLLAMGRSAAEARATLRFSVGHGVDDAQIEAALARLPDLVARVREAA